MLPFAPDAASPGKAKNYVPSKSLAEASGPLYLPLNLDYPGLKKVHNSPPIYVCEDFLTDEECDAFIATAGPLLQRSKTHAIAGTQLHLEPLQLVNVPAHESQSLASCMANVPMMVVVLHRQAAIVNMLCMLPVTLTWARDLAIVHPEGEVGLL